MSVTVVSSWPRARRRKRLSMTTAGRCFRTPPNLEDFSILDNGMPIVRVLANRFCPDLARAGIGHGRHSFEVDFPGGLSPLERHVIQVARETDGAEFSGSRAVIQAAGDEALSRRAAR